MDENKEMPIDLSPDQSEDIEIEFVDEDSGAGRPGSQSEESVEEKGLEAVDLGPSVEIEIERLESELDELRDIHLRKLAEFDNFRKRTERERVEIKRHANEDLVLSSCRCSTTSSGHWSTVPRPIPAHFTRVWR